MIAETNDLPTRFVRIVVTDDGGRCLLPDLPKASYDVWVRNYGLVSLVLNSQMGQTFHDFVNGYRVREVQRRIRAGDARALKMLALAMDAGTFATPECFGVLMRPRPEKSVERWSGP